ncbi:CopG family transcriptional regulator [Stenotrophomonas rhizophila]|uniref:CopG family transcriptional regulator n=1 Tax=Stenotrophomonas rhizophila TaxID=216778 RepID=UPI001F4FFDD1|nr:CopG family transcriptional regulator [Stenotrophomonas rhizophila]
MTIKSRVKPDQSAAAPDARDFVGGATDGSKPTARGGVMRGKREQITHTMPPEMLVRLDRRAKALGITRAAYINLALSKALESGV